jgi:excisionase family DNA binding protein
VSHESHSYRYSPLSTCVSVAGGEAGERHVPKVRDRVTEKRSNQPAPAKNPAGRAARPAAPASKGAAKKAAPVSGPGRAEVTFLTVAEVAAMMRVSKMTVYRMVHAGEMPAVRVGRSFRVPEQAVHDYLRDAFIEAG